MLKRASWGLACLGLACLAVPALAAGPYAVNVAVVDDGGALLPNTTVTFGVATADVAPDQGRSVWGFKTTAEMVELGLEHPSLGSAEVKLTMPAQAGPVFVVIVMSDGEASARIVSEDEWPGPMGTSGPGDAVTSAADSVFVELTAETPAPPSGPAIPLQGGENCGSATVIASVPTTVTGTTAGYLHDYDEVCPYGPHTSPDVVYVYSPVGTELVSMTLCVGQTNYDTKLFIYENDCVSPYYDCNDDACSSPYYSNYVSEIIDVTLVGGNDYYIVVDGYGGSSGNYTLDITGGPPPLGACCVDQVCVATNYQAECDGMDGQWYEGETCPEFECPGFVCDGALYYTGEPDNVNSLASDRRADGSLEAFIIDDVEFIADANILDFHWWAVTDATYTWAGTCDFIIVADAAGVPGATMVETSDVACTRVQIGVGPWAGRPLYIYTIDGIAVPVPAGTYWVGLRPVNQGAGGQNFWMTAPDDGTGAVYFGSSTWPYPRWTPGANIFGVPYEAVAFCVTGEYGDPPTGACCDDATGICVDDVLYPDCLPPLRFAANTPCSQLDPPCGGITGACCYPDGSCLVQTVGDCTGDYQGNYTDCDPNPCPQPNACDGDDVIYYNGFPDGVNGVSTERRQDGTLTRWIVDDVVVTAPWVVTDFHWWTIDTGATWVELDDYIILTDSGSGPGAVVSEVWDVPNTRFDTGMVMFGYPVYMYTIVGINESLLPGGYWLGLRPVTTGPSGQSFWATAPLFGQSIWLDYNGYWEPGYPGTFTVEYDVAFCITGVIGEAYGACCDDATGICNDGVSAVNCPPPLRFAMDTLCADLVPPCGMLTGACCYPDGTCLVQEPGDCTGDYQGDGTDCDPNPCPQPGDDCDNPAPIGVPGSDSNTTCGRGNDYSSTCLGSYDGGEDMMYEFVLPVETCISAYLTHDASWTGMAIDDSCPLDPSTCIAKDTASSGPLAIELLTLAAGTYYIQIDTWPSPDCINNFTLDIIVCPTGGACCLEDGSCVDVDDAAACTALGGTYQGDGTSCALITCPGPNDDCEGAIPVAVPSGTPGTTVGATVDSGFPPCGGAGTPSAPGVWYSVTGTGNTMTASLCDGNTSYDSKLTVYCPDCVDTICVDGNDDFCGLQSEVTWCSQAGANYLILVHGYSSNVGAFELDVWDGASCTPTVFCFPAEGACCDAAPGPGCTDGLTEEDCDAAGGTWLGQDTTCDDPDCNDNGQNDGCDLAQGISEDCNNNGVPDECDIAGGGSEDCQPDGIPDECQLAGNGRVVLWDNGPLITDPGAGCGGEDASILCTAIGAGTYGYGCQLPLTYMLADDFVFDSACTIDSIRIFGYQTGAPSAGSTLNAANINIWDGDPSAGGNLVATSANMTGTDRTTAWRALDTDPTACNRNHKYVDVDMGGLMLNPGTYWIGMQLAGSGTSGPWMPPVTIPCAPYPGGNGMQSLDGGATWAPVMNGTMGPDDFPFIIEGNCGPLENDCNGNGVPDECDEPVCGNNCLEGGAGQYPDAEECDGDLDDACPGECYPPGHSNECQCPGCGDGVLGPDEDCDDGNNDPCDGCSADCRIEECGDGIAECGEGCDDGNTTPCDGCSSDCRSEGCGDGIMECGETCDDGNTTPCDGCSADCRPESCGDGIAECGEQCDDGNNVDEDGCNAQCQIEYCGDGVLQEGLGEECDDGNIEPDDGCSADCLDEAPEAIPTVSTWGLLILALLLLVAGKVYFGRRRARVSA